MGCLVVLSPKQPTTLTGVRKRFPIFVLTLTGTGLHDPVELQQPADQFPQVRLVAVGIIGPWMRGHVGSIGLLGAGPLEVEHLLKPFDRLTQLSLRGPQLLNRVGGRAL